MGGRKEHPCNDDGNRYKILVVFTELEGFLIKVVAYELDSHWG